MDTLKGKIALVTGGNRGIGEAVALALAKVGVDVAINYRARAEEAEKVCAEIRKIGRRAVAIQADVSKSPEVTRMVSQIQQELGGTNILVNNAGMMRVRKPEEITETDWDEHINVNLKSAFLVTQLYCPRCGRSAGGGSSTFPRWQRRLEDLSGRIMQLLRRVCWA